MTAQIIPFSAIARPALGWTEQEKADLYRCMEMLAKAGVPYEATFGITDEGDPWLIFENPETDEVAVHIARIGGDFIAYSEPTDEVLQAGDFRSLLNQMVEARRQEAAMSTGNVYHLVANAVTGFAIFVATALISMDEARADQIAVLVVKLLAAGAAAPPCRAPPRKPVPARVPRPAPLSHRGARSSVRPRSGHHSPGHSACALRAGRRSVQV